MPIGLFDSGLGGLTVVRRVRERLPQSDLLFFADQAHVPYGDREPEDLHTLLQVNLGWLDARRVEAIVMACNTSCAIAERFGWPSTRARVFDLIDSAALAVESGGFRRVGVVATAATVRTGAYTRRIHAKVPGVRITERAAPELVPLVEAGAIDSAEAQEAVARVCAALPGDLDAVIYGCTHYPVLERHFRRACGEGVALIDPAIVQAQRVAAFLATQSHAPESGRSRYVTNGDAVAFHTNVVRMMGDDSAQTEAVAAGCT